MSTLVMQDMEARSERGGPRRRSTPRAHWILAWVGGGIAVVAGLDFVLTWLPPAFGNVEWEFGTVTASFNGLPALALGLALVMYAGVAGERPALWWAGAAPLVLLTVVVLGALVVYLTTVPMALGATTQEGVRLGIQKAVLKTVVQGVVYPVVFTVLVIKGWKALRT